MLASEFCISKNKIKEIKMFFESDKYYIVHPESGAEPELIESTAFDSREDAEFASDLWCEQLGVEFYDIMQGNEIIDVFKVN